MKTNIIITGEPGGGKDDTPPGSARKDSIRQFARIGEWETWETMEEIEAKILNVDPAAIQKKLAAIGALKVGEFFYRRRVFDYPDWRLDKAHSWLRIRDEGDRVTLGFKQRIGADWHDGSTSDTGMEELEVVVSNFDTTAALLFRLGFIEKHYAENRRIRWRKGSVEFDIDTWPELPTYLEIEAPTWEHVDDAIRELGLNPVDKKIFSTNQIYAMKGIKVSEYIRLGFDGMQKRDV